MSFEAFRRGSESRSLALVPPPERAPSLILSVARQDFAGAAHLLCNFHACGPLPGSTPRSVGTQVLFGARVGRRSAWQPIVLIELEGVKHRRRTTVACKERKQDRYGRFVAVCSNAGIDLNTWSVAEAEPSLTGSTPLRSSSRRGGTGGEARRRGLDPRRGHTGPRALRQAYQTNPAQKGHLAPSPPKGLATHPQSIESYPPNRVGASVPTSG